MRTRLSAFIVVACGGAAVFCVTGCEEPNGSPARSARQGRLDGGQTRIASVSVKQALAAAADQMRPLFRKIDIRGDEGVVLGTPTEYVQQGGAERIRDTIGYTNRLRRTGTLTVRPLGDGCLIVVRIDRERLDTADQRTFQRNDSINDVPNDTPIDRDAGLTSSQDQAWTPIARDRGLEQNILTAIRNRFEPAATQPGTTTESGTEPSSSAGG